METNAAGTVIAQCTYAPFGQVVTCPTDDGANHYRFTGQERDTETGLDNFRAREFTSQFGRFSQPDPAGLAAVDPNNPQTWNRYSYTANNPINFVDPSGRHTCWDSVQTKYDTTIEFYDCPDALDPPLNAGLVSPFGMGWMPCGYTGSGCRNQGGGGIVGPIAPIPIKIQTIRSVLVDALLNDPQCLSFLNGAGGDALKTLETIPIATGDLGGPSTQAATNVKYATSSSNLLVVTSANIIINENGWFFSGGTATANGVATGSPQFQGSVLFHELGHATNVLLPDANSKATEDHNNTAISLNCANAIKGLSNIPTL